MGKERNVKEIQVTTSKLHETGSLKEKNNPTSTNKNTSDVINITIDSKLIAYTEDDQVRSVTSNILAA